MEYAIQSEASLTKIDLKIGLGMPLFSPGTFSEKAQAEIIVQVDRLRQVIYKD